MTIKDHLKLFLADALIQIIGFEREGLVYGLLRLDTRQRNILRERRRMTKSLWYEILNRDNWTCQRCQAFNYRNQNPWKPKLEVDHIKALYQWGKTERGNLQALCRDCNRRKGTS